MHLILLRSFRFRRDLSFLHPSRRIIHMRSMWHIVRTSALTTSLTVVRTIVMELTMEGRNCWNIWIVQACPSSKSNTISKRNAHSRFTNATDALKKCNGRTSRRGTLIPYVLPTWGRKWRTSEPSNQRTNSFKPSSRSLRTKCGGPSPANPFAIHLWGIRATNNKLRPGQGTIPCSLYPSRPTLGGSISWIVWSSCRDLSLIMRHRRTWPSRESASSATTADKLKSLYFSINSRSFWLLQELL